MKDTDNIMLTAEGYLELEQELNMLKTEKRPEVIKALKEARALGDLSENSDYDAARNEQAQVEARIKELEYKLEHSTIADATKSDKVNVGSKVTIAYDDGEVEEYKIVGSLEADPFENKISNESPIGKAIIGHKKGETVEVSSPNGSFSVTIKSVA
jgi:transcription elongation factor GreA